MSLIHATNCRSKSGLLLCAALAIGTAMSPAGAAEWIGPTSGNQDWNVSTNWDNNNVPDSGGETGTIGDTLTNDRTISIPTLSFNTLEWTSDPATFTDTLLLSGNVSLTAATPLTFANAGTAAQKVLDLNAFTLNANGTFGGAMTLRSSTPGGVLIIRKPPTTGAMQVESGVTVQTDSGLQQEWSDVTFQNGSVYRANSVYLINSTPTTGFYDFEVTDVGNPTLKNNVIRNDVTIASGGTMTWSGSNRLVKVGGDFTDLQAGNVDYGYVSTATGSFVFNGGAITQRTLTVNRTGITKTSFHIGESSAISGNVKLGANLATESNFFVRENSLFDTADFTVAAGNVVIDDGAELTYTIADADSGLIHARSQGLGVGNLTLNGFTLNLQLGGGWTNGNTLVLMAYDGALSGTPALTLGDGGTPFTYDSLLTDNGQVRLTNLVVVPEPASLVLLALGAALCVGPRRHKL